MTVIEIGTKALEIIGAVATVASVASAFAPKESTLGKWLAWFASMPIKHAPSKLPKPDAPAVLVLLALGSLCLPLCSGCVPNKATLPTPREAVVLAYNVTDDALAAAIIAVPLEELPKLKPEVDKMPEILESLKTGQDVCAQLPELESVVGAFGCDDCETALKIAAEVCR